MSKICSQAADDFVKLTYDKSGHLREMENKELVRIAAGIVEKYGQASGTLACEMYEKLAALDGQTVNAAEMAEIPSVEDVAKAVNGAGKINDLQMAKAVERLVKQVGADTTLKNAKRDSAQVAWISSGDACAYCLQHSAKGWHYVSENTVGNGYAQHIHANCKCQYAVRFKPSTAVEGYRPDVYKDLIYSMDGKTMPDRINALRRYLYAEKKKS